MSASRTMTDCCGSSRPLSLVRSGGYAVGGASYCAAELPGSRPARTCLDTFQLGALAPCWPGRFVGLAAPAGCLQSTPTSTDHVTDVSGVGFLRHPHSQCGSSVASRMRRAPWSSAGMSVVSHRCKGGPRSGRNGGASQNRNRRWTRTRGSVWRALHRCLEAREEVRP